MHLATLLAAVLLVLAQIQAMHCPPEALTTCINSGTQDRATTYQDYLEALPTRQDCSLAHNSNCVEDAAFAGCNQAATDHVPPFCTSPLH
jgi:hypothetical protein